MPTPSAKNPTEVTGAARTPTTRPSDAELVQMLRGAADMAFKLGRRSPKSQRFYDQDAERYQAAANALSEVVERTVIVGSTSAEESTITEYASPRPFAERVEAVYEALYAKDWVVSNPRELIARILRAAGIAEDGAGESEGMASPQGRNR